MLWMVSSATKDGAEVFSVPPKLLPGIPNHMIVTLDYSTEPWDTDILREKIKFDFVNVLMSYPMKFNNFQNGGAEIYAVYDGRVIANGSLTSPERSQAVRECKIYAANPSPVVFNRQLNELFTFTGTDFFFLSDVPRKQPRGSESSTTFEIIEYYGEYGINGKMIDVRTVSYPLYILNNFITAWTVASRSILGVDVSFGRFILNSIIVTSCGILGSLTLSSLGAYALSKLIKPRLSNLILLLYLATIMIPGIMTLIPTYELFKNLNLLNTLTALFIGSWFAPITVYFFKGFFDELPNELLEAARIDGAGQLRCFISIVLPLSKPVFSAMTILTFIPIWNDFLWPFLTVQSPEKFTYAVALYRMTQPLTSAPNLSMALSCLAAIPTIFVFAMFQKAIQKGVVFSGIKG